jgi:DNA-binding NtrC family response regulator
MARVLLIDDEAPVRSVLRRVPERHGHEVIDAATGRQALRSMPDDGCDLVITDINMPEMDGIEVIVHLAKARPGLPVIAISGGGLLPKELLLANADVPGAVTSLPKPFDMGQLVAAVDRGLAARGFDPLDAHRRLPPQA